MTNLATLRKHLKNADFAELFNRLGWDRLSERPLVVAVDGAEYTLQAVAHKRGLVVYTGGHGPGGGLPDRAACRRIDREVAKVHDQHLIIFIDAAKAHQLWLWVKKSHGQPARPRLARYHKDQPGDALLQKLQSIRFTIAEEDDVTHVTVTDRVRRAFDIDQVTKRFYKRFDEERQAFLKFIQGLTSEADRQWYSSVMLNRLMFVWFLQSQRFLNGERDYLRNRLERVQQERGADQFHSFYRYFLLRLFHDGLGKPKLQRTASLEKLLGNVPYLNGGIFDPHELEIAHKNTLNIPDEAFDRVFRFFEGHDWTLEPRPPEFYARRPDAREEINPDVLGYIFEKYINQKQMGAYYTKEDITSYIAKSTILPFLLDAAARQCPAAFAAEGPVWKLLREDPDAYIYEAVRHGVIDPRGEVIPLPPALAEGLADISKRGSWNRPASDQYGLPTETWREHVARRRRCLDLRQKLAAGEIHAVNDLTLLTRGRNWLTFYSRHFYRLTSSRGNA